MGGWYIGRLRPIRRIFGYLCSSYGPSVFPVKVLGNKMYFPRDSAALALVMSTGLYEKPVKRVFKSLVRRGMTVVDAGAGFGYYTLLAARLVGKRGCVYAFEPEPSRYDFLLRNVQINAYTNVTAVNIAISDKRGRMSFFVRGETSSLYGSQDYKCEVTVDVASLDDYFGDGAKIDLIKMDIEGSEMHALLGMKKILKSNPNLRIITEFYPRALEASGVKPEEFIETLVEYGFRLYEIDESRQDIKCVSTTHLTVQSRRDHNYSTILLCIKR